VAEPHKGRPWLVPIGALRRRSGSIRDVEVTAPIADMAVSYSRVPDDALVTFRGTVASTIGGVVVAGKVSAPVEIECRRCLDTALAELDIEVKEVCTDDPDPDLMYPVEPDWLDLEPLVHDACILELPLAPLCREDCKGLCPECGVNRNSETCSCLVPTDPNGSAGVLGGGGEL